MSGVTEVILATASCALYLIHNAIIITIRFLGLSSLKDLSDR
jgi:hypothetical protein